MRFTKRESEEISEQFVKMREAIVMAENRLEAALLGGDVCKHCVELAQSYLRDVLERSPQASGTESDNG